MDRYNIIIARTCTAFRYINTCLGPKGDGDLTLTFCIFKGVLGISKQGIDQIKIWAT